MPTASILAKPPGRPTVLREDRPVPANFHLTAPDQAQRIFQVRLAQSPADLAAVRKLKCQARPKQPDCGSGSWSVSDPDAGAFDEVCDHLLVENREDGETLAACRMQSGRRAAQYQGYWSSHLFDLDPWETRRAEILELDWCGVGQASLKGIVLQLLWRGIAFYARASGARYLIGCCSTSSTDPRIGASLYDGFRRQHLAFPELPIKPWPNRACPLVDRLETAPPTPSGLATWLSFGAKICGPPALDPVDRTIDFLAWLDLQDLTNHGLGPAPNSAPVFSTGINPKPVSNQSTPTRCHSHQAIDLGPGRARPPSNHRQL